MNKSDLIDAVAGSADVSKGMDWWDYFSCTY